MKRFVGRVGHSKNPLLLEDMVLLEKVIMLFQININSFAICRENDCHAHIYIESSDVLVEKSFKKALFYEIYEVLPKFKKTGKGGDQLVTMKEIKSDTKKYKELTSAEQINFQCFYIFKDINLEKKSQYILYNISEDEAFAMQKSYYDNLSIIAKNKKALTGPGKAASIRDKLFNYFNKERPRKTDCYGNLIDSELFLEDILTIVIAFYAHEVEVAHTTHDIERYTMLLYSKMESNKYKDWMFSKLANKLDI